MCRVVCVTLSERERERERDGRERERATSYLTVNSALWIVIHVLSSGARQALTHMRLVMTGVIGTPRNYKSSPGRLM